MGFEELEGSQQAEPVIMKALVGEVALFGEEAQALDAVVVAEDVTLLPRGAGRENQVPLFDDEQEEQAIDQAQQVLVVGFRGELAVTDSLPQCFVVAVREEAVGEIANRLIDGLGQAIANARAGIE